MALTATPQSALPNLSWDETIVPALRKRLESESRVLSKRMSTVSNPSGDEGYSSSSLQNVNDTRAQRTAVSKTNGGRVTPSSTDRDRPSGIPRPSLNYSRANTDLTNGSVRSVKSPDPGKRPPMKQRSRTFSQPYPFDPSTVNNARSSSTTRNTNVLPTPASSRSNSPAVTLGRPLDAKPTRIPKVAKTPSSNSNGLPLRYHPDPPHVDEWNIYQQTHYASSQSSLSVPRQAKKQTSGIMNEQPPFTANSYNSSIADDAYPRRSAEEELPFEHWYRGDVSRNGGVGELRVANRMEMLEIANYGHKLRQRSPGAPSGRRRRAESIGNRESVVFDDYERGDMVLDETPLTDMEADTETEHETSLTSHQYHQHDAYDEDLTLVRELSDSTAVATTPRPGTKSQTTPTQPSMYRAVSEPPDSAMASSSSSRDRARGNGVSKSQSQSLAAAQKRSRTKSPAPSANKKTKGPGTLGQKRSKSTMDVRSTTTASEYPEPPDMPGGMADAIPSWTQPKPKTGNWDEVVLPVVARKMGLDDQYEEATGSPVYQKSQEEVAPPAPGTFGFDPSKRKRFDSTTGEAIPMDEFGNLPPLPSGGRPLSRSEQKHRPRPISIEPLSPTSLSRHRDSPPPSPAPFSHYATYRGEEIKRQQSPQLVTQRYEEPEDTGCCAKCIIM